jgi:hypothetical protein
MHNPFAPLIAIAQRGIPFTASHGQAFFRLNAPAPGPRAPGPHPGDASCKKSPPDASPNLQPPPQLIEKKDLTTSSIIIPHTPTRCVTQVGCLTGLEGPGPRQPHPRSRPCNHLPTRGIRDNAATVVSRRHFRAVLNLASL